MESIDEFMEKINVSKHILLEMVPQDVDSLLHLNGRIQIIFPKSKSSFVHLMVTSNNSQQNYEELVALGYKPVYIYDYEKRMRNAITKIVKDDYVENVKASSNMETLPNAENAPVLSVVVVPEEEPIASFDTLRKTIIIPPIHSSSDSDQDDEDEDFKTPYQIFLTNLQSLGSSPTKQEVGQLMYFVIRHSPSALSITELICSAVLDKPCVLYLINDILANSSCGFPDAWRYKVEFEKLLPTLFKQLSSNWKRMGLLRKEEMRKFVMGLLKLWEKFLGLNSVDHLRNEFLGWEKIDDEDLGLNKKTKPPATVTARLEVQIDQDSRFRPIETDNELNFNARPGELGLATPKLAIKPITLRPKKPFQMKLTSGEGANIPPAPQLKKISMKSKSKGDDITRITVPEDNFDDSVLLEPDLEIDGLPLTEDEDSEDEAPATNNSEILVTQRTKSIQKFVTVQTAQLLNVDEEDSDDDMFA